MIKIDRFAPVIIPTLNRYEHFRKCFESLEKCTYAEETDVYVGLDYPPSEKYIEGWKKIDRYLQEKEKSNNFKHLFVRRRNYNCGIGKPGSNAALLLEEATKISDVFITTEDDNEFSPNFLEYMNQGLQKFKNDDNCVAICGYNYIGMDLTKRKENIYLSREFSAWGVGYWTHKQGEVKRYVSIQYAKDIMSSWKNIMTIYKHEPRLLNTVLLNIAINKPFGDTMIVCYQYLEDKYSVFPKVSKVRNHGFDGTGTSIFKKNDEFSSQIIDQDHSFFMDDIEPFVDETVQKELENLKWFKRSWFENIVVFIRVFIYWLTKVDILYFEQKRRNKALFKR